MLRRALVEVYTALILPLPKNTQLMTPCIRPCSSEAQHSYFLSHLKLKPCLKCFYFLSHSLEKKHFCINFVTVSYGSFWDTFWMSDKTKNLEYLPINLR